MAIYMLNVDCFPSSVRRLTFKTSKSEDLLQKLKKNIEIFLKNSKRQRQRQRKRQRHRDTATSSPREGELLGTIMKGGKRLLGRSYGGPRSYDVPVVTETHKTFRTVCL